MRAIFRHSSAPRSSRGLSIFPSRPDLKAATRSFRRRRKSLTVHGRGRLLAYVQLAAWRESLLRLRRSYPRSYLCRSSGAPHPAYWRCLRPALYSSLRSSPSHPTGVSALRVTIAIANVRFARKQWGLRKSTAKSRRLFRNESATRTCSGMRYDSNCILSQIAASTEGQLAWKLGPGNQRPWMAREKRRLRSGACG